MSDNNLLWVQKFLRKMTFPTASPHCVHLIHATQVHGTSDADTHDLLVTPLYGGDITSLEALTNCKTKTPNSHSPLPLTLTKRILTHFLLGLSHAHKRGVAHLNLEKSNILFENTLPPAKIESWLEANPPALCSPSLSYNGVVQAAVTQRLPPPTLQDAMHLGYILGGFTHGMSIIRFKRSLSLNDERS